MKFNIKVIVVLATFILGTYDCMSAYHSKKYNVVVTISKDYVKKRKFDDKTKKKLRWTIPLGNIIIFPKVLKRRGWDGHQSSYGSHYLGEIWGIKKDKFKNSLLPLQLTAHYNSYPIKLSKSEREYLRNALGVPRVDVDSGVFRESHRAIEKRFSIKKICKKNQVHFVSIDDISSKNQGPAISQRCIPVKKLKSIMKKI